MVVHRRVCHGMKDLDEAGGGECSKSKHFDEDGGGECSQFKA